MSRRTKIIIAVVILLLLLLLGVLLFLRPQANIPGVPPELGGPAANGNHGGLITNYSVGSGDTNIAVNTATTPPPPPKKADERNNLRATAKSFAELFGSFSTEGNYQNIVDAEFYMTPSLRAWADAFVADARSKAPSSEFYGITTRAISTDITAYDQAAGTATVMVKTQRRETGSTAGGGSVYYQDLKLEFNKTGDAWKVNTATWLPK
ncbi:MAG TPA: hypothetical protein VL500_00305 [Candidatus Eisenbacteria bacterium]|nr:hypothetical protein [Candidatus Eisenbacteria bacterium]